MDEEMIYNHAADLCPTSEPCPGIDECADCQFVLDQVAESLGPGEFEAETHVLTVHEDLSWTATPKRQLRLVT